MVLVAFPKFFGSITTSPSHERSKTSCSAHSNKVLVRMNHVPYFHASEALPMTHERRRVCECFDLYKELVPYGEAWSWQKSIVREKKALVERNKECPDTLIILQHQPVYTMGTGSSEEFLNFDIRNAPFDIYRTERGGEVTYHGPGQLVMYPIINLRNHKMDLHWYLRALEEVVIRVLHLTFSVKASRLNGFTGVWVGNEKLAAIGVRVSQWIAYHGLALNVTTDLAPFQHIVPCGIRNRQVGSIKELIGETTVVKVKCRTKRPRMVETMVSFFSSSPEAQLRHRFFVARGSGIHAFGGAIGMEIILVKGRDRSSCGFKVPCLV